MRIIVHLHSILQRKTAEGMQRRLEVEMTEGSTVIELVTYLEIDIDPDDLLLAVNGRMAKLDQILQNDDDVHLMLPISGGQVNDANRIGKNITCHIYLMDHGAGSNYSIVEIQSIIGISLTLSIDTSFLTESSRITRL